MTDEAIAVLDRFLDTAMMASWRAWTIIHGKGTGAVRKAVREHLKRSRYIKSFRPGRLRRGGGRRHRGGAAVRGRALFPGGQKRARPAQRWAETGKKGICAE